MEERISMRTDKTLNEIESSAEEVNEQSSEKLAELRERLSDAIESAKVAARRLEEKTIAAAKATDRCIRDHPYQTMGIVFGLGVIIGLLARRRRD